MKWITREFSQLSTNELYDILHLRSAVFVVEQHCNYQDLDYNDQKALHLMGYDDQGRLSAYTRLFPPGVTFDMASIGRVLTAAHARGSGAGKELMQVSIDTVEQTWGKGPIKIGAQLYLQKFYESFGFEKASDMYYEDDIEHIKMVRK
ncbi:GNAT family N-acetyltransferase [Chitinophaga horti]|uniref:GNAT family N-acetyltransferase n=1 Tax=Chitinophaga horti TaxID=2920382 RepID=A0ABY6IXX1_9BACT|nr:GNAT family N-acetyltransferase [Chitinophaga horti]UYQ92240.1 GNAT family N-acetyltransferase [Chitinophaga horti]